MAGGEPEFLVFACPDRIGWHFRKCEDVGGGRHLRRPTRDMEGEPPKKWGPPNQRCIWLGTSPIPTVDQKHLYLEMASCFHQPFCKSYSDFRPLCEIGHFKLNLVLTYRESGQRTPTDTAKNKYLKQSEEEKHIYTNIHVYIPYVCAHICVYKPYNTAGKDTSLAPPF